MNNYTKTNFPIRISKKNNNSFVLFNTGNYISILLDELSYQVFLMFDKKHLINKNDVISYIKDNKDKYTGNDIVKDSSNFLNFLLKQGFINVI